MVVAGRMSRPSKMLLSNLSDLQVSPTTGTSQKFGQTHLFDKNTLAFNSRSLKDEITEERFQPETGHSMPNSFVHSQAQIPEDPELELIDQGSSV